MAKTRLDELFDPKMPTGPVYRLTHFILNLMYGTKWPVNARYSIWYRKRQGDESFDEGARLYFRDKSEMRSWLRDQRLWSEQDDNNQMVFAIEVWTHNGPRFYEQGEFL